MATLASTYAARLRLGHTALMSPVPTAQPMAPGTSRRAGGRVRYAEIENSDDEAAKAHQTTSQPLVRRVINTPHVYYGEEEMLEQAVKDEWLVPIRLDIDLDTHRVRDCFLWNLNDELMTPEKFAEILCTDLDIPSPIYGPAIAATIHNQLNDLEQLYQLQIDDDTDTRLVISLDIQVGNLYLRDRFEWDVTSTMSPEEFAHILCADMGLGGEFPLLVAYSIRDQLTAYHRAKVYGDPIVDLGDGTLDSILRRGNIKEGVYRPLQEVEMWTPIAEELTQDEVDRILAEQERKIRRQRREIATSRYTVRPKMVGSTMATTTTPARRIATATGTKRREGKTAKLTDEERLTWACMHCGAPGRETLIARMGPEGPKTLCNACGLGWETHGSLPSNRKDMFRSVPS